MSDEKFVRRFDFSGPNRRRHGPESSNPELMKKRRRVESARYRKELKELNKEVWDD